MSWQAWALALVCVIGIGADVCGQPARPSDLPPAASAPPAKQPEMLSDPSLTAPLFAEQQPAPPLVPLVTPEPPPVPPEVADAEKWPSLFRRNDYRSTYLMGGIPSALTGITSITTATATQGTGPGGASSYSSISTVQVAIPVIAPGLLTSINSESARPIDRVYFGYGYDFHVRAFQQDYVNTGFNMNRFDVGVEKTFLSGDASIDIRVPYLLVSDNTTNQGYNGFGNISAGLKYALCTNPETGSVLSVGMTVAVPTSRNLIVTTNTFRVNTAGPNTYVQGLKPPPGSANLATQNALQTIQTYTINPTYYQPYVSGTYVSERFFVSNYLAMVYPSDDRVPVFLNDDFGFGYQCYSRSYGVVRSITPTFDLQFIVPVNHQGVPIPYPLGFLPTNRTPTTLTSQPTYNENASTQVYTNLGGQLGLWERTIFSATVVLPIAGPKSNNVGFNFGFNFLY